MNKLADSVKENVSPTVELVASNLRYIICFTGNNDEFVQNMVYNFYGELRRAVKKESVIFCEPLEEFVEILKKSINDGELSDIKSLTSKANETLTVKYKLLQDRLPLPEKNAEYLIINSMVNAEEIILIQEKYGIAPIIIEIFDANPFRQIQKSPWKSVRSSMRLCVNNKSDIPILYRSLVDYLFKALCIRADYKDVPENRLFCTANEFDRLTLCAPHLFDGCFKKVYPSHSKIETYMQKSPKELEDSYNSTSEEENMDSDCEEEYADSK
uniref:Uncharacterized protein n=1 Tax=Panagrolaimus sp. ES5 TaxID=591445 RepID=A0AC34FCE5_9BILA